MEYDNQFKKLFEMADVLDDDDKRPILHLISALKNFLNNEADAATTSPVPYYQLISAIIQHPQQGWLLNELSKRIKEAEEARGKTSSSTSQGTNSLKLRPQVKTKMARLEQTINFLQLRHTKLQQVVQNNSRQRNYLSEPKIIAALDAFLDLITSLFSEPSPKRKIKPGSYQPKKFHDHGE